MEELDRLLSIYNPHSPTPENMVELLLTRGDELAEFISQRLALLQDKPDESSALIALHVLAPLAGRINMQAAKKGFEDIAFAYLYPQEHALLVKMLCSKEADTRKPLLKFILDLRAELDASGLKVGDVSGRMKQPYSLYKKLRKSGTISDIHDLLAVRVLVDKEDQCYEVLDIAHARFEPILSRFKDYIKRPKPNGYRSLHTTLQYGKHTVELQIRTHDMHAHAEGGSAAHWHYDRHKQTKHYERGEGAKAFAKEKPSVVVFSPKGDPYQLNPGATALDFAFAVHTGVGLRTSQVKVNGKISNLDYELGDGDQVEVLAGKEARPREDWLRIVTSRKAKARIRTWLREADRERFQEAGKALLTEEFAGDLPDNLGELLPEYSLASVDDLFVAVGAGYVSPRAIYQRIHLPVPRKAGSAPLKATGAVLISGMEDLQYRLGQCCAPARGDVIVGYITRSLGITVHKQDCPEVRDEQERTVACSWR